MLGRELGRGATGRVYVAEDAMLARPVAIKLITDLDPGARQRFLLEARAVAKIHHPNVVEIYRVGTLDNRMYFVTELVRGESLAAHHGPLAAPAVLDIAIGIARGLAAAHRRNVVHCDLKPSNVMIDADGTVKIIDFGLARIVAEGSSAGPAPAGTPDYMAPEVWLGEAPGCRADVYSLGAVVYELLAGAPPFADVAPGELRRRVTEDEPPALRVRAPDVDPRLAEVVARCLRRDPLARFADGDELREALERLRASARQLVRADENPYRGLRPFEASHRGVFFGRRSEIDAVVERLRGEPIVIVTGDSGVGKSSLCRAGVIPAVLECKRGMEVGGELGLAWQAITLVPGPRPLTALATALGEPGLVDELRDNPALMIRALRRRAGTGGLLVFIDQLEELITLGDPAEVAALDAGLVGLLDGAPGLRLLASVRADFLARISTLPELGRDLSRLLYFLRPLPPERLRDVIVGPATAVGARFESDAIVSELIAATARAGSGGLPLLSFALADLWEARDHADVISHSGLIAMGGVSGALARHADVVIGAMIADERVHARRLLLRLATAMGTRARRPAHELALDDHARVALDALVDGRLVVVHDGNGAPEYELAHECLLTGWPTLRDWLDADTAGRATRERLAAATVEWLRLDRSSDATWQGARLAEAIGLDPASLNDGERAFIVASRHMARRQRSQRGLTAFGVVALVVLAFAAQRSLARRELAVAVDDELGRARAAVAHAQIAAATRGVLATRALAMFDAVPHDGALKEPAEAMWTTASAQRALAEQAYRTANRYVEIAFAKDPTRADVRDLTGDIVLDRMLLADAVYLTDQRDDLIDRIALYDADGHRRAQWAKPGIVHVRAPADAVIIFEPDDVVRTGATEVILPPGNHVVAITTPGRVAVRAPILVERGAPQTLDVAPPRIQDMPPNMVYVPGGEFLYGDASDDDRITLYSTVPLHRRTTQAFLIGTDEVTFADWLAYVDAQPAGERSRLLPAIPAGLSSGLAITPDGAGHWRIALQIAERSYTAGWNEPIVYTGRTSLVVQDWRKFPVLGVSADDAIGYAAWLSRTGALPGARLCNELEWERAARGADGRNYPTGRTLADDDANIDVSHVGAHGAKLVGPDEVGSHPASRSPFGLDDTAGNAFEWTVSEQGGYLLRSGSYQHDRKTTQLTNRSAMPGTVRDASIGFRLCATPALPR